MFFKAEPLTSEFGLRINDLDLRMLSHDKVMEIIDLVWEHQVLVVSGQKMTPTEQIEFCRKAGPIFPHPLKNNTCQWPEMTYVTNVEENGEARGYPGPGFHIWHSDMCYEPNPPRLTTFYAEKVPEEGGNTLFCNTLAAYEDLPKGLKDALEDKQAVFGFSKKLMQRCQARGFMLEIDPEDQRPDTLHPVFRPHPHTGRKSIYINWTHTDAIVGMSPEDSDYYLDAIFSHCKNPSYIYAHSYQEGDFVIWDNNSTLHTGDGAVPEGQARIMRRVVIK